MKTLLSGLFAVGCLLSGPASLDLAAQTPPAKSGWKSAPPSGNPKSRTLVDGTSRPTYYELSAEEPILVAAKGPATLLINTVLEFPAGATTTEQEYTMLVEVDGKKPATKLTAKAMPDTAVKYLKDADKFTPGVKKPQHLDVPAGDHSYALRADPACGKIVCVRLYVLPKFAGSSRSMHIDVKGKKSRYYALTAGETVRVTATGPMELRLFSKLDFAKDAKGPDGYNIFYSMDGGRPQRDSFNSDRSKTGKYADPAPAGATPGRGRNKVYDVPAGKHTFVFSLDKAAKQTVWVRLYLRKK